MSLARPPLLFALFFSATNAMLGNDRATQSVQIAPVTRPVQLFNGKDLVGWTTWLVDDKAKDPRGVFSVKDGVIRISGEGFGYLATRRAYRDYHLTVEMKWGRRNWKHRKGKARDSGVFLHAVGPDGNSFDADGAYMAAIECQVMQGAVGDLLLIKGRDEKGRNVPVQFTTRARAKPDADGWPYWQADGKPRTLKGTGRINWQNKDAAWKDTLDFRGRRDVESPRDKWTRIECICRGSRITVLVNGRKVNEAYDVYPAVGKILLQCEGSEVFYRKVELRPLAKENDE